MWDKCKCRNESDKPTGIGWDLQMGHGQKTSLSILLFLLTTCSWSFCHLQFRHSFPDYCKVSTLRYSNTSIFLKTSASLQLIQYLLLLNRHDYNVNYRFPPPGQRVGTPTVLGSIKVTILFLWGGCQLCHNLHIAGYVQFIQGDMIWKTLHDSGQFHERKQPWGKNCKIILKKERETQPTKLIRTK